MLLQQQAIASHHLSKDKDHTAYIKWHVLPWQASRAEDWVSLVWWDWWVSVVCFDWKLSLYSEIYSKGTSECSSMNGSCVNDFTAGKQQPTVSAAAAPVPTTVSATIYHTWYYSNSYTTIYTRWLHSICVCTLTCIWVHTCLHLPRYIFRHISIKCLYDASVFSIYSFDTEFCWCSETGDW